MSHTNGHGVRKTKCKIHSIKGQYDYFVLLKINSEKLKTAVYVLVVIRVKADAKIQNISSHVIVA